MAAILLSGANKDGARGLQTVHRNGGYTIVQDPASAQAATMPLAALALFKPNQVLTPDKIIHFLKKLNNAKNNRL